MTVSDDQPPGCTLLKAVAVMRVAKHADLAASGPVKSFETVNGKFWRGIVRQLGADMSREFAQSKWSAAAKEAIIGHQGASESRNVSRRLQSRGGGKR